MDGTDQRGWGKKSVKTIYMKRQPKPPIITPKTAINPQQIMGSDFVVTRKKKKAANPVTSSKGGR